MKIIYIERIDDLKISLKDLLGLNEPVLIIDGCEIIEANIPWIESLEIPETWIKLVKSIEKMAKEKGLVFPRLARIIERVVKYTGYLVDRVKPRSVVVSNMFLPVSMMERDLLFYWLGVVLADSGVDTVVLVATPNDMFFAMEAALKKKIGEVKWRYVEIDDNKVIPARRDWNILGFHLGGLLWRGDIRLDNED